ncbi:MAG: glycosyltransferase family 2 protein [Kiritimatiellia bacterium]
MKLSIVTINLNHADGLRRTAESVIGQTFRDFEFIVVDGGSTDGSRAAIEAHADRIAHWVSEPDGGIYAAMNKGLRRARGEYVHFLNSGDTWAGSGVLERIFAQNEFGEDLLYGNALRPDESGAVRECRHPEALTVAAFFGFGVCQQAIFYRRALFDALGEFDESLRIAGDWEFNLRALMARRTTRYLAFPVVCYQGGGISVTRPEQAAREKEAIWKRHLPEAVYRDYERLAFLEKECARLKTFEDWTEQIRRRSLWTNCAMAVKWWGEKWLGRGGGGRPGRGA